MAKYPPDPRKYEMMIVVAPTVGDDGLPAVIERVSAYVTEKGGELESVNHENPWGRRRLAYEIQNFQDAYYVLFYFHIEPKFITEIERDLRLEEVIIRHLLVKYDPLTERVVKPPRGGAAVAEAGAREERQPAAQAPAEPAAETASEAEATPEAEAAPEAEAEPATAAADEPEEAEAEPAAAADEPEAAEAEEVETSKTEDAG